MNQAIQWAMFIAPWLTLFFMKGKEVKRFIAAGLLSIVLTTIVHDVGITFGFWVVREATYPFYEMMPYFYGTMPVLTMWVLNFTFGHFWRYMIVNTILDLGFAFIILDYFYPITGVYGLVGITPIPTASIALLLAVIIYPFQILQDDIFIQKEGANSFSANLKPVAAKPLPEEEDN
ncbi:MAG: hypothetical protein K0R55_3933 [Sporomusa sp.]|jgi:hypothetical protein|nr:hypothetical protein [Sporomusa sp.]